MPYNKKPDKAYRFCIICKKKKRHQNSLFCNPCSKKSVFIKIEALRKSRDYKQGWITAGMQQHPGRLPKRM